MSDKLRTLKNMLFESKPDLGEALKILLSDNEETTYAIRNDEMNVYYKGHSLMKIKSTAKGLGISFNGGHFRYCDGNKGKVNKSEAGWEDTWNKEWEKINQYLMTNFPQPKKAGLTAEKVLDYKNKALMHYQDPKNSQPSLILKWQIENVQQAKDYNSAIVPFLKNEMKVFIGKEKIIEREYANKLMLLHSWKDFDQVGTPKLFFSDCEYKFPDNKRDLLRASYPKLLDDLENWPDPFISKNSGNPETVLLGDPDGIGAIRRNFDMSIVPCLIEIKYGTAAYGKKSGIRKHIRDMVILADHTMEDRKKEIEFSYHYRKGDLSLEGNAEFPWAENASPLLLFILQTSAKDFKNDKELLQNELKELNMGFNNKLIQHVKEKKIDINFVFTFNEDGKDFLDSYKNEDRCFDLEQLI